MEKKRITNNKNSTDLMFTFITLNLVKMHACVWCALQCVHKSTYHISRRWPWLALVAYALQCLRMRAMLGVVLDSVLTVCWMWITSILTFKYLQLRVVIHYENVRFFICVFLLPLLLWYSFEWKRFPNISAAHEGLSCNKIGKKGYRYVFFFLSLLPNRLTNV